MEKARASDETWIQLRIVRGTGMWVKDIQQNDFSPGCFEPRNLRVMGKDIYEGAFLKGRLALTILFTVKSY